MSSDSPNNATPPDDLDDTQPYAITLDPDAPSLQGLPEFNV